MLHTYPNAHLVDKVILQAEVNATLQDLRDNSGPRSLMTYKRRMKTAS